MAVEIKKGSALSSLSIMPLIDVVFLLLIFFLVATTFVNEQERHAREERELKVDLPIASEAAPISEQPKDIYITITAEGKFNIDGSFVDASEVEEILANAVQNNPANQSVVIRADKRVEYGYVSDIVNLCNRTGVTSTSFGAETEGD